MIEKNITQDNLFQTHLAAEKISVSRTMSLLGTLLFLIFIIADILSVSATLTNVLVTRGFVIAGLLAAYAFSFSKVFLKYYDITLSATYLLTAAAIEVMIYLSVAGDHASNVYFAGLILVMMTLFGWSFLNIKITLINTVLIVASYSFLEITREISLSALFVNIFFLLSASAIGFVSQHVRDRYVRENFILQQSLKEALQEKTVEAIDNQYLANHDSLTDLPNRRYITKLLEESLQLAKKEDRVMVIMFFDLNGFKQVNDIYGHYVGDEVLKIVAKRLEVGIRKGDNLSRLSGDEYLIGLLMDKENLLEIEMMADKFSTLVSQPMNINGLKIKISISVGIAAYPMHGNKVSVLMDIADKKMYKSKQGKIEEFNFDTLIDESVVIFPGISSRQ